MNRLLIALGPLLIVLALFLLEAEADNWGLQEALFAGAILLGFGLWTAADVSYSRRTGDWGIHDIRRKEFWTQALKKTHRTAGELWLSRFGSTLEWVGMVLLTFST